jgi:hypothetical protein
MMTTTHDPADSPLACVFCGATVPDVESAIDAGWSPSYDDAEGMDEIDGPVCGPCAAARLRLDGSTGTLRLGPEPEWTTHRPGNGAAPGPPHEAPGTAPPLDDTGNDTGITRC